MPRLRLSCGVAGVALMAALLVTGGVSPARASVRQAPSFTVSPQSGPVGTLVHFEGDVDAAHIDMYRTTEGQGLWGTAPPDCAILVPFEQFQIDVTDDGHATGSFVVGSNVAGCNMNPDATPPATVPPGPYGVTLVSHCCPEAQFRITSSSVLARTGEPLWQLALLGVVMFTGGELMTFRARRRRRKL